MAVIVAPSILAADFPRLGEEVRAVDDAGADWIPVHLHRVLARIRDVGKKTGAQAIAAVRASCSPAPPTTRA